MDALYKIALFIMLVFFLINNAKAGKTMDDVDLFDTHSLADNTEFSITLD